ncbi:YEATS domain-containing protein 2 [Coemansia sp. RSA 2703]|nr:YEATS domain-containing protein 2 [Coemansia sp. RSA 2703]KAJ2396758.1 YEATS domain-containing protein 2 [Coemansia sp. RSA 2603]
MPLPQFDTATAERVRRIVGEQFDVELLRKQHEVQAITQRLRHGEALLGVLASGIRAQHGAVPSARLAVTHRERATRAAGNISGVQPAVRVSALAHTLNSEQMRSVDEALEFIQARRRESDSESDGYAETDESAESDVPPPTPALSSRFHVIRRAVVGNTAERVADDGAYTHRWTVYVRGRAGDASPAQYVRRVRVFLHPSYRPDDIVDLHPPLFELTRHGWGEFPVRLQVFFVDRRNKPVDMVHMLRLDGRATETPVDFEIDRRGCDVASGGEVAAAGPGALLAEAHAHAVFCSVCGTLVVRPRTASAVAAAPTLHCCQRCETAAAVETQAPVVYSGSVQPVVDSDGDHPMAESDSDSDKPVANSISGHSLNVAEIAASLHAFHQRSQAERASESDSEADSDSDSESVSDSHSDSDRAIDWVWSVVRPLELTCAPASRFSAASAPSQSADQSVDQSEAQSLVRLPNCSDDAFADALDQRLVVGRLLLDATRMFLRDLVAGADRSMRANRVATIAADHTSPSGAATAASLPSQMTPQLLMLTPLHVLAAANRDPHAFDFCSDLDNPSRP